MREELSGGSGGAEHAQVVSAAVLAAAARGEDESGGVDPLLLRAGDPEATARMTAADFDPEDALGPDVSEPVLDPAHCALTISVEPGRIDVSLVARRGELVSAQRIPAVGADMQPERAFDTLTESVTAVLHAAGIEPEDADTLAGIGVVAAGTDVAAPATAYRGSGWRSFPLRERLSDRYGLSVTLQSPAAAMTAGEHWRGAGRGRRNMLGVVLGHGIDGALVIDGRMMVGTTGNAGHIGHVCVDPYGPPCACGGRGCLQAVAGGAAIAEWARTHGGSDPAADARAVTEAARRGDPVALATLRRAGEAIGQAVAGAVTLLDLDVVVLGGPLAGAGSVLFDPIADGYARFAALNYASPARVVPALLGREGAQVGAAAAVLEAHAYPTGLSA
ncbi:ROK family protein [Nakamurella lactea]|uniref:ROK family protein n=1 Tax=Nakamurella lactea TaxID=459515 RepID=UPI0013785C1F|nr:ROK family protein [Nakamurella lactea]